MCTFFSFQCFPVFCKPLKKNGNITRSSHPEVLCKKGVLRNFTKFTGKHQCQSLFFNKVAGMRQSGAVWCLLLYCHGMGLKLNSQLSRKLVLFASVKGF